MKARSGTVFLLLAAAAAQADWSATLTYASEYELTGISQSASRPVLQAGVNYAHPSGWYAGTWASSGIDFGCCGASLEVDYYLGYFLALDSGLAWDISLNEYTYPGSEGLGYREAALAMSLAAFEARLAWSDDFLGTRRHGYYLEAAYEPHLAGDWYLLLHAGRTGGPAFDRRLIGFPDYADYALGVAYRADCWEARLRWVEALLPSADRIGTDLLRTTGRWVFDLSCHFE